MSGGSYDYAYHRIEELADAILEHMRDPDCEHSSEARALRAQFADHLRLVAAAAHAIEWVDSGDYSPDDEIPAIEAALSR